MDIFLLQPNPLCGAMDRNARHLAKLAEQAIAQAVPDRNLLLLCPDGAIVGQPWSDLARISTFYERSRQGLDLLAALLAELPYSGNVQLLIQVPVAEGGQFALLRQAQVELLPLSEHGLLELPGLTLYLPELDPISACGPSNVELTLLAAPDQADLIWLQSPRVFRENGSLALEKQLSVLARHWQKPLATVNLCGGNGGLIYEGQSCCFSVDGQLHGRAKAFAEDILPCVFDSANSARIAPMPGPEQALFLAASTGIRDYVRKSGFERVLLGLSGGLDSALVACLAAEALGPEQVLALLMPSPYSTSHSLEDAQLLARNLGLPFKIVPIAPMLNAFNSTLAPGFAEFTPPTNDLTEQNLQARIRGVILMAYSNYVGALVLGTGNKSEAAVGYNTLYGDTIGCLEPLGDIYKSRLYAVARWYNQQRGAAIIPQHILDKAPSAELWPDQKDEDSLPPYPVLDAILRELLENGTDPAKIELPGVERATIRQVATLVARAEFKRHQSPESVGMSRSVFGPDWHLPVPAVFW